MIIIVNNYKSITLLTKRCSVALVKRFTGNKKFTDIGASMLNKCNKGIGCAMQANQKNTPQIQKLNNTTTSSVTEPLKDFNTTSTTWKPYFIADTFNQKPLLPVIVPEEVLSVPIPAAPPLPSTCLSSPKNVQELKAKEIVGKYLEAKYIEAQKLLDLFNSMKINQQQTSTFTNANKQPYATTITKKTTVNDLTEKQILQGMIDRGLLKKANDSKNQGDFQVVPIELQNGESFPLNKTKHNVKLSQMGQAYAEHLQNKPENTPINDNFAKNPKDLKYLLIVPPKADADCLVENSNKKHLVVAFDNSTGEYYAVGFLTSKKTGNALSMPQYKTFTQSKQNLPDKNNNSKSGEKAQHIKPYYQPTKIDPKDITVVKYSDEYFEKLSDEDRETFEDVIEIQKLAGSIVSFDKKGLMTEHCLQICKEFDEVAAADKKDSKETKKQHPITKHQQKKNEENKKNMEEKKNKQQDSNDNTYNHEKYL